MQSPKKILITGGSGMIGTRLTALLTEKGLEVAHLVRSAKSSAVRTFIWHPDKNEIDKEALLGVEAIVHLAGAGIADKRWNEQRKKEILLSRTQTARLLINTLKQVDHRVSVFISASGISYYGLDEAPTGGF